MKFAALYYLISKSFRVSILLKLKDISASFVFVADGTKNVFFKLYPAMSKQEPQNPIDGYGSKSTNSDLAGLYLLLYICQHAGLFRRRTNLNDVFDNKKIVSCQ
jgi:hypothetical protein